MSSHFPETRAHTGGDAVVDALENEGVEAVFGIPSVHNLPIYDALARRGTIRVVTVRHEQDAAAAADGYSRVSGRLGVFLTSSGPGAANAMGGLLEAFVSGSPVLHLTGQIETRYLGEGRGFIHEVPDQPAMLASLSKSVLRARSSDEIAGTVSEAARLALSPPHGPVSVEIPIDLQYAEAVTSVLPSEADRPPATPQKEWEDGVTLLSSARRPILWAGGGVVRSGAEDEVAALARRIGAGVLTSPNGRGVIPEDDPLCIGNLPWDPGVRQLVAEADLLVGVGTRYQGPNTENWKMELPGRILQIDLDPSIPGRNYRATVGARGDAGEVVRFLLGRLGGGDAKTGEWQEKVRATAAAAREALRAQIGPQAALLDELIPLVSDSTVVVKDSTIPAYTWGNRLLPVRRTRTAIMPNGFAIGLGLGHALGAAVATGGPPVLCMVGDGGFLLAAGELASMAAERLPVVILVFNDAGYGILRNIQDKQYGRRLGVDLGRVDFAGLARSLGVPARKATGSEEFGLAVKEALGHGGPFLVEVDLEALGPMANPYTGTSRPPR